MIAHGLAQRPHVAQPGDFHERTERLSALTDGEVRISVAFRGDDANTLRIQIEDSGAGFDVDGLAAGDATAVVDARLHGRGLRLVRELCDRVDFDEPGNRVTVEFPIDA